MIVLFVWIAEVFFGPTMGTVDQIALRALPTHFVTLLNGRHALRPRRRDRRPRLGTGFWYAGLAPVEVTVGAIMAGMFADALLVLLGADLRARQRLIIFAGAVPAVLWAVNFGVLALGAGVRWPLKLWSGTSCWPPGRAQGLPYCPPASPRYRPVLRDHRRDPFRRWSRRSGAFRPPNTKGCGR